MRILAFSDLHCDWKATEAIVTASKDADLVIGAGDFAICGAGEEIALCMLQAVSCPVVMVCGNHDRLPVMQQICADWDNGHVLHGDSINIDGVEIFGLGYEIPRIGDYDWNQSMEEDAAREIFAAATPARVLVTHTPPMGFGDQQKNGNHEGSNAILETVRKWQPELSLFGHIHNSWGAHGMIGRTRFRNLGPVANWFEL